jgi:glycosyltransferase involved in cell wall biosynthesis
MMIKEWEPARGKIVLIPPPPNLHIVPSGNGTARTRGRSKLGLAEGDFVVCFFGYLYPIKGVDTLLRAFASVADKRPNAKMLFIGGRVGLEVEGAASYFEEMQTLARDLRVEGKTVWTGAFKSDEEEASLYLHASDVCVLPFLEGVQLNNSSFASVIAHGLPTIVTQGPMTDKAFVDGKNVLTCLPNDPLGVAKLIMNVMDNPDLSERLRLGARQFAADWFSWDAATERTLALLSKKPLVKVA